jgi:hypothetical protein
VLPALIAVTGGAVRTARAPARPPARGRTRRRS